MDKTDLRDLLTQFAQHPATTMRDLIVMLASNLWDNKFQILLLIAVLLVIRTVLFALIDSMVPSRKNPARGHLLRRFLIRKVTDREGRLISRLSKTAGRFDRQAAYYSRRSERAAGLASLIKSLLNFTLWAVGIFIGLAQLGITTSAETNGLLLGGLGLAIALGAQNLIRDVIGGFHVLAEDQYGLGDYVDAQFGVAGVVTYIGLRTTRLKGADGTIYHVRHSKMDRIANRTQATGSIILDVTLTWNDMPEDKPMVQVEDLKFAETTLASCVREIRATLDAVSRVASGAPVPSKSVPISRVAEVVTDLVPHLSEDTLTDLAVVAQEDEMDEAEARAKVESAIDRVTAAPPVLSTIEVLGLVDSTADSLTLRMRVRLLSPESRGYALSVIRRQVFEDFAVHNISTQFSEVPEGVLV